METTPADIKVRQKAQWSAAAPAWDRWFSRYEHEFGPMMRWCCDAARLAPGMQVLDVACGTGLPALWAAERVHPGGRVTGIDLSAAMLGVARRRADAVPLPNVEFLEMDGEQLEFPDDSFDALLCACGVMFFPDAIGALGEMRRVLRRGGRLAVTAWDDPVRSPFLTIGGRAIAPFFPPAPPDPRAPGGFRFAQPGSLQAALEEAGFSDITVESRPMTITCTSTAEYWEMFTDMAAGIKDKIASLAAADQAAVRGAVDEVAARYAEDGMVKLQATPLCAVARKEKPDTR
jgi:SAM-dependent methyltransferase